MAIIGFWLSVEEEVLATIPSITITIGCGELLQRLALLPL